MPVTRIPVAVYMDRVPVQSRWISEKWQPSRVEATGAPQDDVEWEAGAPEVEPADGDARRWRFPGCTVELHRSEAEGYFLNLSAPAPCVFVMWRTFDDGEPRARPVVVTVSYNEAARMMDGGEQVDRVAMPPALHALLGPYVALHYKPEPRKKARRNDPFATDGQRDPAFDAGKIRRS